jgi:hypothetical protein
VPSAAAQTGTHPLAVPFWAIMNVKGCYHSQLCCAYNAKLTLTSPLARVSRQNGRKAKYFD